MSGTKFLLDTNFILGLLKSHPAVLAEVSARKLSVAELPQPRFVPERNC